MNGWTASLVGATLAVSWCQAAAGQQPKATEGATRRDFARMNVCKLVPGEAVARAIGMRLADAQAFNDPNGQFSRCTYLVVPVAGPGDLRKGYSVWLQPPEAFEELRRYTEAQTTPVPDLADGAYLFQDPGDGRFKLRVLKKRDVTIEATADTAEAARRVAEAAIASLWPVK